MTRLMTKTGAQALAAVVAGAAGALCLAALGRSRWAASTNVLMDALEATRRHGLALRYDPRELEGLPAPVQRYFRAVLLDGQPIITGATIALTGRFNLSATSERWTNFSSVQRAVTSRPGFVWDGRISLAPGVAMHVCDAYIGGVGILKPSLMGLYALGDVHGGGEFARGELMRYFAEAAWYPTALLPSQGVRWEAVDDHTATATLSDRELSVTMRVGFNAAGLIESAHFDARGAMVGNRLVPTPWEGRWSNYQEHGGIRVPMTGEAAWLPAAGRRPYFRGSVTALRHFIAA